MFLSEDRFKVVRVDCDVASIPLFRIDVPLSSESIYPKGGTTGSATVNPYNFKPIFTQEQLVVSVQATVLLFPSLHIAIVVDLDILHQNILSALLSDLIAIKHIFTDGQWSMDPNSLLLLDNRIYIPSASNLHTHVLQYNYNHILARHFGQKKHWN